MSGGAAFLGGVSAGGEPVMMGALPTAAAFLSNPPGGIMGGWGVQGAGSGFSGFGMGLGAYGNQQAPEAAAAAAGGGGGGGSGGGGSGGGGGGGGEEGDATRGPGRGGRAPRGGAKKEVAPKATAAAKGEEQRKAPQQPGGGGGRQRKEGSPPGLGAGRARGGRKSDAELSAFDGGGDGGDEFIGASAKQVRGIRIRLLSLSLLFSTRSGVCRARGCAGSFVYSTALTAEYILWPSSLSQSAAPLSTCPLFTRTCAMDTLLVPPLVSLVSHVHHRAELNGGA